MTGPPSNIAMRIYMTAGAIVAWFALLLQVPLTMANSYANGLTTIGAVIVYLSFFTLLSNLLVALGLTFSLWMPNSRWGRFFSRPEVISGTAVYILIVGVAYSLLLRHLWNPEGLQKVADILQHDVAPVMYVGFWLFFAPKIALRWKIVLWWLIYPLSYLLFVLLRGALSGRYPYPFLDAGKLGYSLVLSSVAMLLAGFFAVGLFVVATSRWLGRSSAGSKEQSSQRAIQERLPHL